MKYGYNTILGSGRCHLSYVACNKPLPVVEHPGCHPVVTSFIPVRAPNSFEYQDTIDDLDQTPKIKYSSKCSVTTALTWPSNNLAELDIGIHFGRRVQKECFHDICGIFRVRRRPLKCIRDGVVDHTLSGRVNRIRAFQCPYVRIDRSVTGNIRTGRPGYGPRLVKEAAQ